MKRILLILVFMGFGSLAVKAGPVTVQVYDYQYDPNDPDKPKTQALNQLMQEDPGIRVVLWGGLIVPGASGRATLMMAIAGQTAPDIFDTWFHAINTDINQGFLYPLNEWIGEDRNGNGQIDDDEARWDGWKKVPKLWRQVATVDGKIYGIPQASSLNIALIFRLDLVRAVGLNPDQPPQTWDEFYYWCQKLTGPNRPMPGLPPPKQRGFGLQAAGFEWLPWMQSAGGNPIEQIRRSPRTGKEYTFAAEAIDFQTPEGEDLSAVPPQWHANFAAPQGVAAAALYHRLCWGKWVYDPTTREPVNLTVDDLQRGYAMAGTRRVAFAPEDVITGVTRALDSTSLQSNPLGTGQIAIQASDINSLMGSAQDSGLSPELLSWFPFPASGPQGVRVVQYQRHYLTLCEGVGRRSKAERDKIWKVLISLTADNVALGFARSEVLSGMAKFVPPDQLTALGLGDYLDDISPAIRRNYDDIKSEKIKVFVEPYMGNWNTMDGALERNVFSLLMAQDGENFDYTAALQQVEAQANGGEMFGRSQKMLAPYRSVARAVFSIILIVLAVIVWLLVRSFVEQGRNAPSGKIHRSWMPWVILAPALVLIALWGYYPLLQGMVMAFQDYKIVGKSSFVGLDNFITLFLDPSWWLSLWHTLYFVILNMVLAFIAPILLALMLTEVPRGKIFFRTLFFLPQVTSGLVIALLWREMYDPTPNGLFNQAIIFIDHMLGVRIPTQTWLQDSRWAMICCVIPTVWAGMGLSSLIYLAALKGVPEEIYEAAEIDGAGIWHKLTRITLPTIFPLILINFIGVFIGTFQSMGNIFLLTYGGPGDATMVAGMKIWIEAYNNLRFSMATSMAWTLGMILIAFTYLQVKILQRVEFKKANWK
jgi:ABC-type sugar transport system permease subunit